MPEAMCYFVVLGEGRHSELKQNASRVVAWAAAGEVVTVTDRGRPVCQIVPIAQGPLEALRSSGRLRSPIRSLDELGSPPMITEEGSSLTEVLLAMCHDERE